MTIDLSTYRELKASLEEAKAHMKEQIQDIKDELQPRIDACEQALEEERAAIIAQATVIYERDQQKTMTVTGGKVQIAEKVDPHIVSEDDVILYLEVYKTDMLPKLVTRKLKLSEFKKWWRKQYAAGIEVEGVEPYRERSYRILASDD